MAEHRRLSAYATAASAAGREPDQAPIEAKARLRFTVAQALAQGRLRFHYQPVVRAANPRFAAFYEMLARLTLPNGQTLPAGAFLPHVEAEPLGRAIDRQALATACALLAREPVLRLSVNTSPRSMGDPEWLATLARAAERDPRAVGRLIIEITENAALDDSGQTADFLAFVHGLGCAVALDDFGAGATGFRHFREFRFDIVKIDGSFVSGVSRSPDARVLIECMMVAARHFEMLSVAERVESEADAAILRALGVDCLQGYRYGRPAPAPRLPEEVEAESRRLVG